MIKSVGGKDMNSSNNYIISCCSTADLSEKHFSDRNIKYVCCHFSMDGKQYLDDLGKSISFDEFYKKLSKGAKVTTSQTGVGEFKEYFEDFLRRGFDILHVSLSSGISGAFNCANAAKNTLSEKYPDRKIYIIDSLSVSSGYGLLMDKIADFRDCGMDIDQLCTWIENNKIKINHWFFTTDLSYLIKGGRISRVSGMFGKLLNIYPLMTVNRSGKLVPKFKIRGKKHVMDKVLEQMELYAENGINYNDKCYISCADCYNDASILADLIEQKFHSLKEKVSIYNIGTVIGCHTGPGLVALFFFGSDRID